ncbi:hypothetical protein HN51_027206 [Arachis hypogaea]
MHLPRSQFQIRLSCKIWTQLYRPKICMKRKIKWGMGTGIEERGQCNDESNARPAVFLALYLGPRYKVIGRSDRTGTRPVYKKRPVSFLERKKVAGVIPHSPPFSNSFLQQTLASTNSCRRLLDERLLPPSIALKNFRLRALGPLARSSTSGARISPFSSVLGCSRLPPPVSARAVRVGCCSSSVVVSARFCLPVSLESRLSHWHLVVRLSRRRRQKQLVGLSLASSPSVGWTPTRRRPLALKSVYDNCDAII